jgi:hypothetical protein
MRCVCPLHTTYSGRVKSRKPGTGQKKVYPGRIQGRKPDAEKNRIRRARRSSVIRSIPDDVLGPVQLLQKQDAGKLMRQGHAPQGDDLFRRRPYAGGQPVRAADDKTGDARGIVQTAHKCRKFHRIFRRPAFVEAEDRVSGPNLAEYAFSFQCPALRGGQPRSGVFHHRFLKTHAATP